MSTIRLHSINNIDLVPHKKIAGHKARDINIP